MPIIRKQVVPKSSPDENKEQRKIRRKKIREEKKLQNKQESELREKPVLYRLFKQHTKMFIAACILLLVVDVLGIAYLLSPAMFRGDSYKFIGYNCYVTLPNTENYKYSKNQKKSSAEEALLSRLVNETTVKKYPKKQVLHEKTVLKSQYEDLASQYGMEYDDLITAVGYSTKTWNKQLTAAAKQNVKTKLVAYAYAREHNVDVSNAEYKTYIQKKLKSYDMTEETFKEQVGKDYDDYCDENDFYSEYVKELVEKQLYKKAKKA